MSWKCIHLVEEHSRYVLLSNGSMALEEINDQYFPIESFVCSAMVAINIKKTLCKRPSNDYSFMQFGLGPAVANK